MNNKEFEDTLAALKALVTLGEKGRKKEEKKKCCENEDEDEGKEDARESECPFMESIGLDYADFINWAMGTTAERLSSKTARTLWRKLHNDLPMPRIFQTREKVGSNMGTIALMLDAYPLYLDDKKKSQS
jgi:hypothetical protein